MNFSNQRWTLAFLALLLPATALGWSSKAGRTENEIHNLRIAISAYYVEHREYPGISTLFEDLVEGGVWSPRRDEKRIVDRWGHELIVRIPGTHEEIDIHSVGPDGIDQDGAGDDISLWAGVNEGYHYKQTWPLGRALLFNHAILGLVFLAAARWLRWQAVIPIAGMIVGSGLIFGCWLLRHPGMMPDRNGPLEMVSYAAGIASLILAGFLVHVCRRESIVRRPSDLQASSLTSVERRRESLLFTPTPTPTQRRRARSRSKE